MISIDLPNLTSIINSGGYSFWYPRSVTLESISKYCILIVFRYSKSSKCQSTLWFIRVCSIEINFEYCSIDLISFIDISAPLYKIVPLFKRELRALDPSITSIIIPNGTYNDNDYTVFDFSPFSLVKSIEIGDDCFGPVKIFRIDGLNRLKTIKIGNNSFTQVKEGNWDRDWKKANNQSRSFHILNCESLESIQIGEYSFCDYAGEFELKNLPQLQSIQIGTIGSDSNNFFDSSFVIRGIDVILNI